MTKPPKSPPHSDIDGVNEDKRSNVDSAIEAGQDNIDVARAKRESVGRPAYDSVEDGADERSR